MLPIPAAPSRYRPLVRRPPVLPIPAAPSRVLAVSALAWHLVPMIFSNNVYERAYLSIFSDMAEALADLASFLQTRPEHVPERARDARALILAGETPSPAQAAAWYEWLIEQHVRSGAIALVEGPAVLTLAEAMPGRVTCYRHDRPGEPGGVLTLAEARALAERDPDALWSPIALEDSDAEDEDELEVTREWPVYHTRPDALH